MPKKGKKDERRETAQIFDLTLKCILREASHSAVVHLINSVHKKNYPLQTTLVKFEPTEYFKELPESGKLQKIITDMVLTLSGEGYSDTYLIEAQIDDDARMLLRIFNYSVAVALAGKTISDNGSYMEITMPYPALLYFEDSKTEDIVSIRIKFPGGESVLYKATAFKILNHSVSELDGMALLLPFYILRIRKELKMKGTDSGERKRLSKELEGYVGDIVKSLEASKKNSYITDKDLALLLEKLDVMNSELYGKYEEFAEVNMNLKKWATSKVSKAVKESRAEGQAEGQAKLFALWEKGVSLEDAKKMFGFGAVSMTL
ncbi:MAG: hypothetical protein FWC26_09740 [Fibromonadales bacterium]|nr:hypothetical protein [Fibromonadales bacterium]